MPKIITILAVVMVVFVVEGPEPPHAHGTHLGNIVRAWTRVQCDDKPGFYDNFFSGAPTDPNALGQFTYSCQSPPGSRDSFSAVVEYVAPLGTNNVFLGIWDWSRGIWVWSAIQGGTGGTSTAVITWPYFKDLPECHAAGRDNFTRCADVYEFHIYYWTGTGWQWSDSANGLSLADWDITGNDDCCHFHWSPNSYDRPKKVLSYSSGGNNFVELRWRMAYYDGMPYAEGTNRLNRLKNWAGAFQVEMRRNTDGWDGAEV